MVALVIMLWPVSVKLEAAVGFSMSPDSLRVLREKLEVQESGVIFYCFAMRGCPYCEAQLRFFSEHYSGSYKSCDIVSDRVCFDNLLWFLEEAGLSGLVRGVPLTLVFKNGELLAVVEGLNENPEFWEAIARAEPSEDKPFMSGEEKPIVLECLTENMCVREGALTQAKLALAALVVAVGAASSLVLQVVSGKSRTRR